MQAVVDVSRGPGAKTVNTAAVPSVDQKSEQTSLESGVRTLLQSLGLNHEGAVILTLPKNPDAALRINYADTNIATIGNGTISLAGVGRRHCLIVEGRVDFTRFQEIVAERIKSTTPVFATKPLLTPAMINTSEFIHAPQFIIDVECSGGHNPNVKKIFLNPRYLWVPEKLREVLTVLKAHSSEFTQANYARHPENKDYLFSHTLSLEGHAPAQYCPTR